MNLVFRKAIRDDLDAISQIYERVHDAEEAGVMSIGWERGVYPVREVAEVSVARGDMYVAEMGGSVIAAGIINQIQVDVYADCEWKWIAPDDDVSVLHTLVVDPSACGQGIGPAFVKFWEDLARESDCSVLRLDTNAKNTRAREMYAKLGYTESAVVPTVFNGIPGVDLVLIEKFVGTELQARLRELSDTKYADFQSALIPGMERERLIGVRTPDLRALAKELLKASEESGKARQEAFSDGMPEMLKSFLNTLPHKYFDEMQLHAFIISRIKDFDLCVDEVERFLPYVDNWATCDQLSPKVFGKKKDGRLVHRGALLELIDKWMESDLTYAVRFGIGMLMQHFLDDEFDPAYMNRVADIRSDEYYINMMIAWYFATALAKQYDAALGVLLEGRLDTWTHNKAIQKAIESRRISDETKDYLRTIKRKTR